ncbi:formate dehydrogenase accessory protein FdhE [candidate division KSB1 bacterium]|nr:formate dehydrogenase accessory protein FdhE [candidate division KSB1 bacterium]MBL7093255.1 formate dehydrogenase accessory protein FdhE [candidate division KSB1 bacterium]
MSNKIKNMQQFSKLYIEFHEKIFNVQVKCMQHLVAVLPFQKLNSIDIAARLSTKQPILNNDQLLIDDKNLEPIFDSIFPVLKQYSYRNKEQLLRLEELNDRRKFSLKQLVLGLINNHNELIDEIAQKFDISNQVLELVGELIAVPYLELSAEYFTKKLSKFHWREPFCPVCGNKPSMAKIDEQDRVKTLWCRFCDTNWTFFDKVCPHCLNDNIETQTFIFPSNNKPFRIEACDKCKNYLKTVDGRASWGEINFSVTNVATYYLDLLAKKHGYNLNNYFKFYFESN